jgi:hypothetical protein
MSRRTNTAFLLWTGLTAIAASAILDAQQPALRLILENERASFELGEPVYLTARLRNDGAAAVRVLGLLDPSDGLLVVSITAPRAGGAGFVPLSVRDTDAMPTSIAPGGQVAKTFQVFFGGAGWVFRTPGTYTVTAKFTIHDGSGQPREIQSNSLSIRIGEQPAEIAGVLLSNTPASREAGQFMVWSEGDHLTEGQALLATLPARFSASAVVDYYRLALGRSLARPFRDFRQGTVRPASYDRAVAELERVRDGVLPSYLRVQKQLVLANAYRSLGRQADATRAIAAARGLIAERPELAELQEQLARMATPAR